MTATHRLRVPTDHTGQQWQTFIAEMLKLPLCMLMAGRAVGGRAQLLKLLNEEVLGNLRDTLKCAVPAVAFSVQGNLLFVAGSASIVPFGERQPSRLARLVRRLVRIVALHLLRAPRKHLRVGRVDRRWRAPQSSAGRCCRTGRASARSLARRVRSRTSAAGRPGRRDSCRPAESAPSCRAARAHARTRHTHAHARFPLFTRGRACGGRPWCTPPACASVGWILLSRSSSRACAPSRPCACARSARRGAACTR